MKKTFIKTTLFLFLAALIIIGTTACKKEKEKKEEKKTIDYLILVNKENKLPDYWEETVDLVALKNAYGDDIKIEKKTYEMYKQLREDLLKDGIDIELDSSYRSVKRQQEIWDEWTKTKGEDYVKKYVAVPGYSEHHTGLAIDVCLKKNGKLIVENDDLFKEKKIFAAVHKKLSKYGFILRYPEGREKETGYGYEPWHFRYVGKEAAEKIYKDNLIFEEYLKNNK